MGVNPLHGVGGRERELAGEQLVESYAEGIKVAARVDGTVHPAGLFGRDVGQRARDELWRCRCLPLSRNPRGDAESRQPGLAGADIDEDVRRLDVLVHDALLVQAAKRLRDADRDTQEGPQFPGTPHQRRQDLATRVLEQERVAAALPHE